MKKVKALVLFSGGLDSILAVKILESQGIEVVAVCFTSNFFNSEKAEESALLLRVQLKIVSITNEILELVKNPPNGYGKNMNPCIDCHSLMIRKAGEIMKKEKFEILASGEVLGQRPFSQNRKALAQVEDLAGVEVLRPLSAKLLPNTVYEDKNYVNRNRLKRISGRQREEQISLSKQYKIVKFPSPAGGCILTDPEFSNRLLKLLDYWPDANNNDVEIVKQGRVFWFNYKDTETNKKILVVIGREHKENEALKELAKKGDFMLELKEIMGPTTLLRFSKEQSLQRQDGPNQTNKIKIPEKLNLSEFNINVEKNKAEIFEITSILTGWYSTKARNKEIEITIKQI